MEAFKLLTRSSTLQKKNVTNAGKASPTRTYPSSGQPARTAHTQVVPQQAETRGTKRKKGHSENDEKQKHGAKSGSTTLTTHIDGRASDNEPESSTPQENRRILRKKKIKVTILQTTPQRLQAHGAQIYLEPLTSFQHLRSKYSVSRRLDANLQSQGYKEPTGIQMGSIPLLLEKKSGGDASTNNTDDELPYPATTDLLAVAPTGSGKTLAFLVPVLQSLIQKHHDTKAAKVNEVQAIILVPSHELVDQIVNEGRKLAHGTGIRVSALKQGMQLTEKEPSLVLEDHDTDADVKVDSGPKAHARLKSDVVVGTPPMLIGAISAGADSSAQPLPSVCHLVFDEADILFDKIFYERTLAVWNACINPALRVSLWSATINSTVESFVQKYILDRQKDLLKRSKSSLHCIVRLVVGLKDSSIPTIDHRLTYAASEQGKLVALRQLMHPIATGTGDFGGLRPPFLVFTQTIPRAIALHSELLYDIPPEAGGSSRIAVLHSDLSETARSSIMAAVRKGEIWVLITTDLLSRGIDFKGMNGVVSYDIPSTSASYVHRAGRTGRQGREGGVAITLYTKEDIPYVKNVANVIAASARAKAAKQSGLANPKDDDLQQWLLDSLPDISKKTRQRLKESGIEHRKQNKSGANAKHARKMRISTKSGYERKVQNRRRATAEKRRQQNSQRDDDSHEQTVDDEWGGFD